MSNFENKDQNISRNNEKPNSMFSNDARESYLKSPNPSSGIYISLQDQLTKAELQRQGISYNIKGGILTFEIKFTEIDKQTGEKRQSTSTAKLDTENIDIVLIRKDENGNILINFHSPTGKDKGYFVDQIKVRENLSDRPRPTLSSSRQYNFTECAVNMYDDLNTNILKEKYGISMTGITAPKLTRNGKEIYVEGAESLEFFIDNGKLALEAKYPMNRRSVRVADFLPEK